MLHRGNVLWGARATMYIGIEIVDIFINLRTYPGLRIPVPLRLGLDCDSEMMFVASEILKLTKIDWNTTAFAHRELITTVFPKRVGDVLSELPDDIEPRGHYKYYR